LAPVVCGLGAALLIMRLFGIPLTLLTIALAPILVGIGVDDGVHVVDRLARGEDVDSVLRETGAAMTLTTLTTVGAFAALSLTTFTGIRELGLIGGVGLIVCLLASLHLIPLGWMVLNERRPPPDAAAPCA
jgi:predicted RND superfamily exporter protein